MLLNWIFAAVSAVSVSFIYGLCPTLSAWWILPLFLGLYVGVGVLYILLLLLTALVLPRDVPSGRRYAVYHWFIQHTLSWVMLVLGYRIHFTGGERLPTDCPFLLVSNHRSGFDPLVTLAVFRRWNLSFICKPEIFKIPVISTAMHRACFLPIDRENPRNAVTTIKRAAEFINTVGLSIAIYPEGTRNKKSEALLPFHAGSFKIAKLAGCPIVVSTVRYTRGFLWGKQVSIHIADVMDAAYVAENNTATLSQRARDAMEAQLNNL